MIVATAEGHVPSSGVEVGVLGSSSLRDEHLLSRDKNRRGQITLSGSVELCHRFDAEVATWGSLPLVLLFLEHRADQP